ncbi:MAG TPA: DUF86 domain-containing protein [bacterium]|nr:DUF86 domain-containing protein [bacterium]HPO09215.1 DUF86 domain-containing protein [bacterium]HQP96886.1 DUF86 domain-containing protein [bacterium]
MFRRPVTVLIEDILEAVEKIERFTRDMDLGSFLTDDKTSDAVVRNFEIIGEAASRLPGDFRLQHSEIHWRKIIGLCHRIVHEYFGIDLRLVWQISRRDLPELRSALMIVSRELKSENEADRED